MRHCTGSSAPRSVRVATEDELVDSLPVLTGLTHPELGQTLVKPRQQDAGLAAVSIILARASHLAPHLTDLLTGDVATLGAGLLVRQPRLGLVPHHELLPRVDDVDDGARPDLLEVLDVCSEETMPCLLSRNSPLHSHLA